MAQSQSRYKRESVSRCRGHDRCVDRRNNSPGGSIACQGRGSEKPRQGVDTGNRTDSSTRTRSDGNATAVTSLDIDEGSAYAGGHPAVHIVPAVLAEAEDGTAEEFLTSVVAGYEVAARVGRAWQTTQRPVWP